MPRAARTEKSQQMEPSAPISAGDAWTRVEDWFAQQGWQATQFQRAAWDAYQAGKSGLIYVPTGSGKTYAAVFAAIAEMLQRPPHPKNDGLHLLYITPLRALSRDVEKSIRKPCDDLGLNIRIETRTGDTPSDRKARQRIRPPQILQTTPESLSLFLSYPDREVLFAGL